MRRLLVTLAALLALAGVDPLVLLAEALVVGLAPGVRVVGRLHHERMRAPPVRRLESIDAVFTRAHHVARHDLVGGGGGVLLVVKERADRVAPSSGHDASTHRGFAE